MDVILNRATSADEGRDDVDVAPGSDDRVVLMRSFCPEDNEDGKNDYKFRAMILFLSQCGVFYCARECCPHEEVGLLNTLVPPLYELAATAEEGGTRWLCGVYIWRWRVHQAIP
jgi:hypothetical protein